MGRRNGIAEFFGGFNSGYSTVNKVLQDKELRDIAAAKAEEVTYEPKTATDDGGVPLEAAKGVKFLGKSYDKAPTDAEMDVARNAAMAGVLKKFGDPVGGLRMEQQARQGQRDEQRFGWEQKRTERDIAKVEKEDADTAALESIDKDVADWSTKRLTNPDGTMRDMSVDDQLASSQYRVSKLVQAGKLKEANALAKDNMSMAANKIQLQTAERNEALAQTAAAVAQGDYSKLAGFYEKFVPDGAKITNVSQDPKSGKITIERESLDGRPLAPHVIKDSNEALAGLKTFQDPMALYNFSQSEFQRQLHEKADKRADKQLALSQNADARAGARDSRERLDSDAKIAASLALFKEQNPNATPAQVEAANNGLLGPSTPGNGKYTVDANEVATALSTPALDARGKPIVDVISGKPAINRNVKEEQKFFQWMKENNITDTNKGLALYLGQKQDAPQSIATDPRALAIRDDKAMTPEQKREKLKALGYQ